MVVSPSHLAMVEMNRSLVSDEAMAAQKISQSPVGLWLAQLLQGSLAKSLTLGQRVPCIEGHAVLVKDCRIEVTLHIVHRLWDEVET